MQKCSGEFTYYFKFLLREKIKALLSNTLNSDISLGYIFIFLIDQIHGAFYYIAVEGSCKSSVRCYHHDKNVLHFSFNAEWIISSIVQRCGKIVKDRVQFFNIR